jgi:adenylate kinase family enzyme
VNKKIHIFGASGSGTSTLGTSLTNVLPYIHLDTDDYFWIKKFTEQREVNEKRKLLREDLLMYNILILSGALCGWGDSFKSYFDLVIFLWIPKNIRLERLQQREFKRYGNDILAGGSNTSNQRPF